MIALDYAGFRAAALAADPFPHIVVREFVPLSELSGVLAALPRLPQRGSFPIGSLRLGPKARGLVAELEGPTFREIVAARFGLDLDGAATMLTLRGQSTERDGLIHRDSRAKRVTVLLYLNPPTAAWERQEGCLRLLRGPTDIDDYAVEVPPANGTLLVFPNAPNAWHGHKPFVGERHVVQLNYMTGDAAARSELRRHRWSALVKRLTVAA